MMNHLMRYSCLLLCLSAGLTACDDDGIDVLDIEILKDTLCLPERPQSS